MQSTSLYVLRDVLADAVLTLNGRQSYPEFQNEDWHRVKAIKDVASTSARNFLLRLMPGEIVEDGIYGDGWEQVSEMQIWTSYANLPDDEDGPMIDEDKRQLACLFVDLIDPLNAGLIAVNSTGWTYEVDAPGKVYGYHSFAVRYLVADQIVPS